MTMNTACLTSHFNWTDIEDITFMYVNININITIVIYFTQEFEVKA